MNNPCKDCICLPTCKSTIREQSKIKHNITNGMIKDLNCPNISEYLNNIRNLDRNDYDKFKKLIYGIYDFFEVKEGRDKF